MLTLEEERHGLFVDHSFEDAVNFLKDRNQMLGQEGKKGARKAMKAICAKKSLFPGLFAVLELLGSRTPPLFAVIAPHFAAALRLSEHNVVEIAPHGSRRPPGVLGLLRLHVTWLACYTQARRAPPASSLNGHGTSTVSKHQFRVSVLRTPTSKNP